LPRQRNIGLGQVRAAVVFFLDDDSLLHTGAAAGILAVYAADTMGQISAVAAAESLVPPPGLSLGSDYRMTGAHHKEARQRRLRNMAERWMTALKPAMFLGQAFNMRRPVPEFLATVGAKPVEYMTGFRMTFRSDAIRVSGFDEALTGYAVDEDIDASFSAMRSGLVVGTDHAQIFHHRHPSGRGDARQRGQMETLNRAYVLLKHSQGPLGSAAIGRATWRRHRAYMALKFLSLVPRLGNRTGRARFLGAWSGFRQSRSLKAHMRVNATVTLASR
jgi:hypothetical protein